MAIVVKLGSFPNSQIKPRSAVRDATVIDISLPIAGTEVQILTANSARVKAIIKNSGSFPINIDYQSGPSDGFTIEPGSALTVEGGGDDVFATPLGGASSVQIDDRLG